VTGFELGTLETGDKCVTNSAMVLLFYTQNTMQSFSDPFIKAITIIVSDINK
jgi:hypothetical protein